jgi:hypothetical protein
MAEVKSIDEIPKSDMSDLTPIEKATLDSLFPSSKSSTKIIGGNTRPMTTTLSSPPTPALDAILDTGFTKKALNTVLLTVLFVILHSVNVSRVIELMNKKKPSGVPPVAIFIGKIIVFAIITFLLLYYNP